MMGVDKYICKCELREYSPLSMKTLGMFPIHDVPPLKVCSISGMYHLK